ncbi:MAG TPA: type I-MYXAN CRISPR-associated protein Cmx8 [Planctomycetaceae bacterium]|jgi:CRISPR-associated protein Cmx8
MKTAAKNGTVTRDDGVIRITYKLFDLPTAQHKAGLAGLVLQIRSMDERKISKDRRPVIVAVTPTSASFEFTDASVQALFDDLYAAENVEVAVKAKWAGQTPIREEYVEETDTERKVHKSKRFVYKVVQPTGRFLRRHFPDGDGLWLKLWRNMLWEIPRGRPTTRIPFNTCAAGKACNEGAEGWKDLRAAEKSRLQNGFKTAAVSSALLLGAQAASAESIPFEGRVEQTFLLHFWPLTVLVFVPQLIKNDGETEFAGFTLAIPEVSDLEQFCDDFPEMLQQLDAEKRGYRPAGAVIDIPDQSALEFMENLAKLTKGTVEKSQLRHSISSVEFMHLVKSGNNVKSMSAGRVAPRPELLSQYAMICGRKTSPYRNPLFRAGLLLALLQQRKWYELFSEMLLNRPWQFFMRDEKTPQHMPWFFTDAATKFQQVETNYWQERKEAAMSKSTNEKPTPALEMLIYRLVRNYVNHKTTEKTGIKWDDFKDKTVTDEKTGKSRIDVPQAYREARAKIAGDVFLALRSRREQDFVDYFTASVCSVGQYLPEDDFGVVANAMLKSSEEVKVITLLALSANS